MDKKIKNWIGKIKKNAGLVTLVALIATTSMANEKNTVPSHEKAIFAGGCFWCMQPPFDKLTGVTRTSVGYCGGSEHNPTYEQVSAGKTGHAEAIEIEFDPKQVSYEKLLEVFWHNIDPTTKDAQFVDHGKQYRTAIFTLNDTQMKLAIASKVQLEIENRFKAPIVTQITKAGNFYPAEEYHQKYYQKNPLRYRYYRYNSGRDAYIDKIWGETKQ